MPGPNFSKAQTYPNIYTDNTIYSIASTSPVAAGYPWSIAAAGVIPAYGQLPNPYQIGAFNPCGYRMGAAIDGTQGATLEALTITLSMFGPVCTITVPTTAFTISSTFVMKVFAEIGIQSNGNSYAMLNVYNYVLGSNTVGTALYQGNNNFGTPATIEPGGILQIQGSYAAAGPSWSSKYNYIEVFGK